MSLTEPEKSVHGTRATYEKTMYGMPFVSMGTNRVKMTLNMIADAAGCRTAQTPPNSDC